MTASAAPGAPPSRGIAGPPRKTALPLLALVGAVVIPPIALLTTMIQSRPYFGLLDDAKLLLMVDDGKGLWDRASDFLATDVEVWGMARPFYPVLATAYYELGDRHVLALYLANGVTVLGILVLMGVAAGRLTAVPVGQRRLFLAAYAPLVFAFPWTSYLFLYCSLQEKWVILAGALTLLWLTREGTAPPRARWTVVTLALLAVGFATKAQFAAFVPLLLLAVWSRGTDRGYRLVTVAAASVVALVVLGAIARRGVYTESWQLAHVLPNLRSGVVLAFVAFVAAWSAIAVVAGRRSEAGSQLALLAPAVFVGAFLVVFLPWTSGALRSYPSSLAGFAVATAGALLVIRMPRTAALAATVVLVGLSSAWCVVRAHDVFGRTASIRELVRSQAFVAASRDGAPVYISCPEGPDSLRVYARRETGGRPSLIGPADDRDPFGGPVPERAQYVVAGRDCPTPLGADWDELWRSGHENGLRLYGRGEKRG